MRKIFDSEDLGNARSLGPPFARRRRKARISLALLIAFFFSTMPFARCRTKAKIPLALLIAFLFSTMLCVVRADGLSRLRFETAEESVLGSIGLLATYAVSTGSSFPKRFALEAGEMRLFELQNLRMDGLRLTFNRARAGLSVSAAMLSSSVGSEKAGELSVRIPGAGRAALVGRLNLFVSETASLARASLLTTTGLLLIGVTEELSVGCAIEDIRLWGEPLPGADTSIWAVLRPVSFLTGVSSLRLDRWGNPGVRLSSSLHLGRFLTGSLGYDDGLELLKAAVTITGGSLGVGVGVSFHRVLGASKGVFIEWKR